MANLGKVGLIENGGGFSAAFSVGSTKAIYKCGIQPQVIQGVSAGALTATKIVEGGIEEAEKVWLEIERQGPKTIFNWWDLLTSVKNLVIHKIPIQSFFRNEGLKRLIDSADMEKVVQAKELFQIVTRNESRGWIPHIFTNHEERFLQNPKLFRKPILATTALQGAFDSVEIDSEMHSDGIFYNLRAVIEEGCDTVFILLNDQSDENQNRFDQRLSKAKHALYEEAMALRLEKILEKYPDYDVISDHESEEEAPSLIKAFKRAAKNAKSVMSSVAKGDDIGNLLVPHRIIVIIPRKPISTLHTFGFERGDIKAAIEQGEDQAKLLIKKVLKMSY